jgi:uncharacterized membrane protein (UPF0127 family)
MRGFYAVYNLDRQLAVANHIAVAGTSALRKQGLLGMQRLQSGAGLWIAPCEAIHTFGMKISLDVIFLDRDLRVKKLVNDLRPRRLAVSFSAYSVLEIEAGAIARSGTRVGDRLRFSPL